MTDKLLLSLDEINVDDVSLVGGKALTLATLKKNKLHTPPGLVLTSAFFEAQIDQLSYTPIWAGSADVAVTESSLGFLADLLKATPLTVNLQTVLNKRLEQTFPSNSQIYAVRSSAIDEDRHDYSFAGVYLTELGVPKDLLAVSITRCWASALSGPAIQYRLEHGMPLQQIKMAVLIQPMLRPSASGVAFTLNPISGARDEVVIEATGKMGDFASNGNVTPYRYHLARQAPDFSILKKVPIDTANLGQEPLSQEQLNQLAKTLEQVEALQSVPQDVEWAFENETLYLLQSRPITLLPQAEATQFDTEWTRANHLESLPELPSPLFMSLMQRTQNRGARFFSDIGLDISGLGPYLTEVYGRPYLNLSIAQRVLMQLGFSPVPLLAMIGYSDASTSASPFRIRFRRMLRSKSIYFKLFGKMLHLGKTVSQYEGTVAEAISMLQSTNTDRLTQFKLRERIYGDLINVGLIMLSALTGLTVAVARIIGPQAESPNEIMQTLGKIGGSSAAARHNAMLVELGQLAAQEPAIFTYLIHSRSDLTNYRNELADTVFLTKFESYLADQGNRADYEPDMSWPRYGEQPEVLLATVSQYARLVAEGNLQKLHMQSPRTVQQAWQAIMGNTPSMIDLLSWRRLIGYPLMSLLSKLFTLRDQILTSEAEGMAAIRIWDLKQAKNWVDSGFLDSVDDYFWLSMAEIERALVADGETGIFLQSSASVRRETYQFYNDMAMPLVIKNSQIPYLTMNSDLPTEVLDNTLMGLPVSPGQVQGVIKILEDSDTIEEIPEDAILVTPSTDPALLPFFPLATGLIVEVGGMLSHGSIIAREYGVPAVSSITDAHKRLKTGDRVLLDGSTGVVQILETADGHVAS